MASSKSYAGLPTDSPIPSATVPEDSSQDDQKPATALLVPQTRQVPILCKSVFICRVFA